MDDLGYHSLRAQGYRLTPQRLAILRVLREAGQHLTPLEVCQRAQQTMPGLTEATVYRSLGFLADNGLILAAHVGSGQLVYEIAGHDHHHVICRACGQMVEIEHDVLTALFAQLKEQTGYEIDSLHTTFFGLCPACQAAFGQSTVPSTP
jgi:Fe2+ or Zn2+ uptake regulation protein